jgi:hypothetical protein
MRPGIWIVVALIVAAGITVHGGLYEVAGTGPESAYVVNRWTGQARHITGATWRPVSRSVTDIEREFQK